MLRSLLPVTVFIGLELTVGFIGNCLILCVYLRAYAHCNFRYFVLFLAVYDLTSCLTTLPGEVYAHFNWYDYKYDWLCKVKSYFNVFTAWGSAFTLFLLALDRGMKICRPLSRQIRPELAWKLCVLGLLLSILVSVPILFLWGLQCYTYERGEITVNVSICEKSSSHTNNNYPFIYISSVYIGPIGLMMAAICLCNIMLARKLMCRMFKCKEMNSSAYTISFDTNGIHKDSSVTSINAITESCITESPTLNNTIVPNSNTSHIQSASKGKCNRSLWGLSSVYSIDNSRNKEPAKQNDTNSFLANVNKGINKAICGRTEKTHPFRKSGSKRTKRRKTLIMLTLTSVYIVTMTTYICLVSMVAEKDGILRKLSDRENAVFFFFLRLYFVNTSINPILYGIMDPRFRGGLKHMFC